jgi:hypothetical protein
VGWRGGYYRDEACVHTQTNSPTPTQIQQRHQSHHFVSHPPTSNNNTTHTHHTDADQLPLCLRRAGRFVGHRGFCVGGAGVVGTLDRDAPGEDIWRMGVVCSARVSESLHTPTPPSPPIPNTPTPKKHKPNHTQHRCPPHVHEHQHPPPQTQNTPHTHTHTKRRCPRPCRAS